MIKICFGKDYANHTFLNHPVYIYICANYLVYRLIFVKVVKAEISDPLPLSEPEPLRTKRMATPEPVSEPHPSAEPEPISEPHPSAEPEPISEPHPSAEPEPIAMPSQILPKDVSVIVI